MSPDEMRSTFASTTGGVMTREVGAVTGELELSTRPVERNLEVFVRYAGAEEWYTVEGSPVSLEEGTEPGELHEHIVAHLIEPGDISRGNEDPTSLRSFSAAS
jgi:hypothetical protein